jgi:mRNA interferase YafQ
MRAPDYSGQFERDVKRLQKRGKNLRKLKTLIELLVSEGPLSPIYKDHALKHNWAGFRDAHIEPDWVLIYAIRGDVVRFERTGTHEDLFEKM